METLDILIPFVFVAQTFIGLCFVIHSRRTGDTRYRKIGVTVAYLGVLFWAIEACIYLWRGPIFY
jgi:hypothetical protein